MSRERTKGKNSINKKRKKKKGKKTYFERVTKRGAKLDWLAKKYK